MDNVCLCEAPRIKAKFRRTWECTICGKPEQPNTAEAAHPAPATVEMRDNVARAIAAIDGINLDWITDQTNPRWQKYRQYADAALAPATEGRKS